MPTEIIEVNGIKVANIKSYGDMVFFGIGVMAGSNFETPSISGVSHFSEHMFFKQTSSKNWRQLNEAFAKLGVANNAYTSNTDVLYHATFPKYNTEKVIDLMMDMFFNSTIPTEELEKERNVIVEEKKMYDDDPKASFNEAIGEEMLTWDVGHSTIGTFETINNISRKDILDYLEAKTNLENMVFICSGDVETADLKKYIEKNIPAQHPYLRKGSLNKIETTNVWKDIINKPDRIKFIMEKENITQSVVFGMFDSISVEHPYHHARNILGEALGGGLYSLLHSRLREELGLCYATGMYPGCLSYPNNVLMNLYGYVSPNNVEKFIDESEKILKDVQKNGIDKDIFECAKTDYLVSILRRTETSAGKANYLSQKLLYYKEANVEDGISKIRSVTIEDCNNIAQEILNKQYNWAVMNPKS